ncbi:MAG: glycosyltransferase family 4 protein [Minisyncoccia bacterium]
MKILLYTQYFPPETNAPANRWGYFCDYLVQHGHEVFVLTSFPNHPLRKIFPGYKNQWFFQENKDGVQIFRTWTFISTSTKFIPRLINYLSFAFSSYLNMRKIPAVDLIIISLPPLFLGLTGVKLARKKNISMVLDVRDLWPEAAISTGYLKRGFLVYWAKKKSETLYKMAIKILVNSPALLEALRCQYALPDEKLAYLPNGADLEFFAQKIDHSFVERQYNLYGKFVVLYTGLLGYAQAPEIMIEAANVLREKNDIVFLIVGTGPLEEKLKIEARKFKLTNIIFTGLRPHQEMPQYVSLADVCLIPYKNQETFQNNLPSKMFDYLAAGKPMIINLEGEASRMILEAQAGLLVKPEDPQALADGILKLYEDKFLRKKMGMVGKTYAANNFDKKELAEKLEEILQNILT